MYSDEYTHSYILPKTKKNKNNITNYNFQLKTPTNKEGIYMTFAEGKKESDSVYWVTHHSKKDFPTLKGGDDLSPGSKGIFHKELSDRIISMEEHFNKMKKRYENLLRKKLVGQELNKVINNYQKKLNDNCKGVEGITEIVDEVSKKFQRKIINRANSKTQEENPASHSIEQ